MSQFDRRRFLHFGAAGIAAAGAGVLTLPACAGPTEPSGDLGNYANALAAVDTRGSVVIPIESATAPASMTPTEDNILGPYHRKGAPFRAKITPPLEPGEVLVVRGRVWGHDTRKPLASAVLDVWQANSSGRYDNDDPDAPPKPNVFLYRARLAVDETGYYEYETIVPGRYQIGPELWRPAHIHYMVACPGYKTLVTQMYFKGDPMNGKDRFIKPSLIIDPLVEKTERGSYRLGTFDIVLAKA